MTKKLAVRISLILLALTAGLSTWPAGAPAEQAVTVSDYNAGMISEVDFQAGYHLIPGIPILWESDTAWRLAVSSVDPDLGISNDASYVKPLNDLMWKLADEDIWLPLSREPEEVTWSTETGSGVIYIDVLVLLDWLEDAPGDYRVELVFTLEAL